MRPDDRLPREGGGKLKITVVDGFGHMESLPLPPATASEGAPEDFTVITGDPPGGSSTREFRFRLDGEPVGGLEPGERLIAVAIVVGAAIGGLAIYLLRGWL